MKLAVLVPARLASTRLPQKLLLNQTGHSLLWHSLKNLQLLRERAQICLVTDDVKLAEVGEGLVDHVFMSQKEHHSGTERIVEILPQLDADWVLNVQADEPEINVEDLFKLIEKCEQGQWRMGTLCTAFPDLKSWENPNAVKLLLNQKDEAIYFSRQPLPWGGDHSCTRVFHHLGVYIYQRQLLESWAALPKGPLEGLERLEQLRALENGVSIVAHQITCAHKGIDTEEDYHAFVQRFKEEK
jgi:3-deoxy-manno-octulosonate cytidylyltransferase (CMP-KDO synthetase)